MPFYKLGGRILGETKYLGFYQSETVWDQEHITRVRVGQQSRVCLEHMTL